MKAEIEKISRAGANTWNDPKHWNERRLQTADLTSFRRLPARGSRPWSTKLLKLVPNLDFSISYTTRDLRGSEQNGKQYTSLLEKI